MEFSVYANDGRLLSRLEKEKMQAIIVSSDKEVELQKTGMTDKV